jgi:hypothetical protein
MAALGAALGAYIGHKMAQERIAREQQRQEAWEEYYTPQAEPPRWHRFVGHPDGTVEEVTKRCS